MTLVIMEQFIILKPLNLITLLFIPVANFTSNITEGYAPLDVQFTNLSTDATDLQWNFGDNSSNTYVANPEHIFTSTGLSNVILTINNSNGVFLPPPNCILRAFLLIKRKGDLIKLSIRWLSLFKHRTKCLK